MLIKRFIINYHFYKYFHYLKKFKYNKKIHKYDMKRLETFSNKALGKGSFKKNI